MHHEQWDEWTPSSPPHTAAPRLPAVWETIRTVARRAATPGQFAFRSERGALDVTDKCFVDFRNFIVVSNGMGKIQTQREVQKNAVYYDKTQGANFRGEPLFQATKRALEQQLNSEK